MAARTPNRWAVLIGINYYTADKCLEGCVNDVEATRQLLESGKDPVNMTTLTATAPADRASGEPVEPPEQWPTRANVIANLSRIISEAQPGDHVYIHYSGHGARIGDNSGGKHSALALVLYETNGCSYFRGQVLGSCLHKMVQKGLLVSVVLDCCYWGDIVRGESIAAMETRTAEYRPEADVDTSSEDPWEVSDGFRDATWKPEQWLVNPRGYTILSAAGPHEQAYEIQLKGGRKRGALSYFLIDALADLRRRSGRVTHHSLYQHLRTKFHVSWPQQVPMHYGNEASSFFDDMLASGREDFVPLYMEGEKLCVEAGEAHGVSVNDEYTAVPYDTSVEAITAHVPDAVKLSITEVRPLSSVAVPSDGKTKAVITRDVKVWKAKPVKRFLPHKTQIGLISASADDEVSWSRAVEDERHFSLVPQRAGSDPCIFNVRRNEDRKAYEIVDAANKAVAHVPLIPFSTEGAQEAVVSLLRHLSCYKHFEGLENQNPSQAFEDSFSVSCNPPAGPEGWVRVTHGSEWDLEIENRGDGPLYVSIFCMNASWGVVNLVDDGAGTEFVVVPPKSDEGPGTECLSIGMEMPDAIAEQGHAECEDLIKVFVTSRPTSFPGTILPKLASGLQDAGEATRGAGDADMISSVVQELRACYRSTGEHDLTTAEQWATRTMIIRITASA